MAESRSKHPNEHEHEVPEPIGDRNDDTAIEELNSIAPENLGGETDEEPPTTNIANEERFYAEERKQRNDGSLDDADVVVPEAEESKKNEKARKDKVA